MPRIVVLRIGHRFFRDNRVTTHVCLTARALGADGVIVSDRHDKEVESTVRDMVERFGGSFTVESGRPWRRVIREWKQEGGQVVHLTAYGLPLPKVIDEIRKASNNILTVVGSEKMPGEVFKLADWNVSVTNQPMSEIAALAVFLDWYKQHAEFDVAFPEARVRIAPSPAGKNVTMQKDRV